MSKTPACCTEPAVSGRVPSSVFDSGSSPLAACCRPPFATISPPYPGPGHKREQTVEMDPASEMKVREDIERRGMCAVGWYHSHPVFKPEPSVRDIENQQNFQHLFTDKATKDEPFLGVIIGTVVALVPRARPMPPALFPNPCFVLVASPELAWLCAWETGRRLKRLAS